MDARTVAHSSEFEPGTAGSRGRYLNAFVTGFDEDPGWISYTFSSIWDSSRENKYNFKLI